MKMLRIFLIVLALLCASIGNVFAEDLKLRDCAETEYVSCKSFAVFRGKMYAMLGDEVHATSDGETWQKVDAVFRTDTYGTYYDNIFTKGDALFVVRDGHIYATKDGVTWAEALCDGKPMGGRFRRLVQFKGSYLYFASEDYTYNAVHVYRSPDGFLWEKATTVTNGKGTIMLLDQMQIVNGTLIALIEDGRCLSTDDGVHFSVTHFYEGDASYRASELNTYGEDFAVAVMREYEDWDAQLFVTNDGINWRPLLADGEVVRGRYIIFGSSYGSTEKIAVFSVDDRAFAVLDNAYSDRPVAVADMDVEAFQNSLNFLLGTAPGLDDIYPARDGRQVAFGSHIYTVFGGELRRIVDGNVLHVRGRIPDLKEAASDGQGSFIASGESGILIQGTLDGSEVPLRLYRFNPDGSGIRMLEYENGLYWLATNSGALYRSENGVDFTGVAALPSSISSLMWDERQYLASADDGIYQSADGNAWTRVCRAGYAVRDIELGGGLYVACGELGTMFTSTDGVQWTAVDLSELTQHTLYAVAYGAGRFVTGGGSGSGGSGVFLGSEDGTHWEVLHCGETGFTPSQNGDILFENCPYSIEYLDGRFFAVGLNRISDGFLATSRDGAQWQAQSDYWGMDVMKLNADLVLSVGNCGVYEPSRIKLLVPEADQRTVRVVFDDLAQPLEPENVVTPLFAGWERHLYIDTK